MLISSSQTHILVIDKQEYMREQFIKVLAARGYAVNAVAHYENYSHYLREHIGAPPDLIILGCSSVGPDEWGLITQILEDKQNLVVFCTALSLSTTRSLFLAGVRDVEDRPHKAKQIFSVIDQVLRNRAYRDNPEISEEEVIQ